MGTATPPGVVRARYVHAPATRVWATVADLSRHGDLVPFTTVDAPARELRVGDRIRATTASLIVDRMVVTAVRRRGDDPDAEGWARWATLRKDGPVLVGEAHLVVVARGPAACTVLWAEDVRASVAGSLLAPLVDLGLALTGDVALARLDRLVSR